jgi:hypothetical protein
MTKHSAFEAEILANGDAVEHLRHDGEELIKGDHFASELVQAKIEALTTQWQYLCEKTKLKMQHLQEAYDLVLFKREADEVRSIKNIIINPPKKPHTNENQRRRNPLFSVKEKNGTSERERQEAKHLIL